MTREEVKAQLEKCPLEWVEDAGRSVYSLRSRVTLVDGDKDKDASDALRIDFQIDVNKEDNSCSLDVIAHGRWKFGSYDLSRVRSSGYIIQLDVLKGKAEECRLSIACRMLGIND